MDSKKEHKKGETWLKELGTQQIDKKGQLLLIGGYDPWVDDKEG